MTKTFYREAVGAFIVYDRTEEKSFQSIEKWKKDVDEKVDCQHFNIKKIPSKSLPFCL